MALNDANNVKEDNLNINTNNKYETYIHIYIERVGCELCVNKNMRRSFLIRIYSSFFDYSLIQILTLYNLL